MAVSAADVKKLREMTDVGMMECKKALEETNGDLERAVDLLRERGIAKAAKKALRVASDGLVIYKTSADNKEIVIAEINTETDFCAKNDKVQETANAIVTNYFNVLHLSSEVASSTVVNGKTIQSTLAELVAIIGENITFRRSIKLSGSCVYAYVHNTFENNKNAGQIIAAIALNSSASQDVLTQIAKNITMHIAAFKPTALKRSDISKQEIDREYAVSIEKARQSGKPETILPKIADGMMQKFYQSITLLEQGYVMDDSVSVQEYLNQESKKLGTNIEIASFVLYQVGEGIEKAEENFAEEVAKIANA